MGSGALKALGDSRNVPQGTAGTGWGRSGGLVLPAASRSDKLRPWRVLLSCQPSLGVSWPLQWCPVLTTCLWISVRGPRRGMGMQGKTGHILRSPLVPVTLPAMGLRLGPPYRPGLPLHLLRSTPLSPMPASCWSGQWLHCISKHGADVYTREVVFHASCLHAWLEIIQSPLERKLPETSLISVCSLLFWGHIVVI